MYGGLEREFGENGREKGRRLDQISASALWDDEMMWSADRGGLEGEKAGGWKGASSQEESWCGGCKRICVELSGLLSNCSTKMDCLNDYRLRISFFCTSSIL